jgi:hypothetical protein
VEPGARDLAKRATIRWNGERAEPASEPLGDDRDIRRHAGQWKPVLDVDVVRSIESRDHLADPAVEAEHRERAVRRGNLDSSHDEAAGRILPVDPDRRVVRVMSNRRGCAQWRNRNGIGGVGWRWWRLRGRACREEHRGEARRPGDTRLSHGQSTFTPKSNHER